MVHTDAPQPTSTRETLFTAVFAGIFGEHATRFTILTRAPIFIAAVRRRCICPRLVQLLQHRSVVHTLSVPWARANSAHLVTDRFQTADQGHILARGTVRGCTARDAKPLIHRHTKTSHSGLPSSPNCRSPMLLEFQISDPLATCGLGTSQMNVLRTSVRAPIRHNFNVSATIFGN